MATGGEGGHTYKWPRPSLTVDAAIIVQSEPGSSEPPSLLLIQRKNPPCKGQWALPGGFVDQVQLPCNFHIMTSGVIPCCI
jgi:8-oxo-dGTP diphosphatase